MLANRSLSPHIYGKERGHTLLYTHSKYTHQRHVRMDQSVSDRNPTIPSMTVLLRPNLVMFNNVDMINVVTNSNDEERTIPLGTTRSVKSLSSSASWLIQRSRYLRRHRVMGVFGTSLLTPSITPMLRTFEKSSVWKDEQSFYLLCSMDQTWLISLEIVKWS